MIIDFKCKETARIWNGSFSKKLPRQIQSLALRKLRALNNAKKITDLEIPPGNHLEALKGNRKGQYSIRINNQWRIVFTWDAGTGGPDNVEIVDYH